MTNAAVQKEVNRIFASSTEHQYMMLNRLQSDVKYYLGYGCRSSHVLYMLSVDDHYWLMQAIYDKLVVKPVWCTQADLDTYKQEMGVKTIEAMNPAKRVFDDADAVLCALLVRPMCDIVTDIAKAIIGTSNYVRMFREVRKGRKFFDNRSIKFYHVFGAEEFAQDIRNELERLNISAKVIVRDGVRTTDIVIQKAD